jgi:RNA polymerase sigma-70 factor (ECF subfamily)
MSDASSPSCPVLPLLRQASEGDEAALDALLRHHAERLTVLARRMLAGFARVKRWAQTDDVLQGALLRLVAALRDVKPQSQRDFLALATLQIRRELIDLSRHYYGPEGLGANHASNAHDGSAHGAAADYPAADSESGSLLQWVELHQQIDGLPEDEREVVGLLFYQGLTQAEAAELLTVSVRTVQRRWHAALQKLHRFWTGEE